MRKALASGNYGRFFKLYREAPNMGGYLIDVFVNKHRILCLQKLCMAYIATNIDIAFMSHMLAFDSETEMETFITGLGNSRFSHFFL